jgi:hypothetical protein
MQADAVLDQRLRRLKVEEKNGGAVVQFDISPGKVYTGYPNVASCPIE